MASLQRIPRKPKARRKSALLNLGEQAWPGQKDIAENRRALGLRGKASCISKIQLGDKVAHPPALVKPSKPP
jgi:hypothetical protein